MRSFLKVFFFVFHFRLEIPLVFPFISHLVFFQFFPKLHCTFIWLTSRVNHARSAIETKAGIYLKINTLCCPRFLRNYQEPTELLVDKFHLKHLKDHHFIQQ